MSSPFDASRRKFFSHSLKMIPVVALACSGLDRAAEAVVQDAEAHEADMLADYTPGYFQAAEWAFLLAACDRLIPKEEAGPGALATAVPVFIDKQMQTPYGEGGLWYMQGPFHPEAVPQMGYQLRFSPQEIYRTGIADTQQYCRDTFDGKRFQELSEEQQIEVLTGLEKDRIQLPNIPAATFFHQLWTNTREGYFADPKYGGNSRMAAWRTIGFPGARADFMDWIKRPNQHYPLGPVSLEPRRS